MVKLAAMTHDWLRVSDIELMVYVRPFSQPTKDPTDIAHDHRRFLTRQELEREVQ